MILGFDFDNTIIRYDALFHRVAREEGLIDASIPVNKNAVRDHLRSAGNEEAWTQMQGTVYGARMQEAQAFPGAIETLRALRDAGHTLYIISHKTRYPYLGERHDLHASARSWIEAHLHGVLPSEHVLFHEKKEEKIARIGALGCAAFVDDLPEILLHAAFPAGVTRYLFAEEADAHPAYTRLRDWAEVRGRLCA